MHPDLTPMGAAMVKAAILRSNLGWAMHEAAVVTELVTLEEEIRLLQSQQEELKLARQFRDMLRLGEPEAPNAAELMLIRQLADKQIQATACQDGLINSATIREGLGISA